jgi:hypothetical protein
MDAHVKVSGAWKKLNGLHVKVSGVWKEVQAGYTKVGGVWKQFYTYALVTVTNAAISSTSGSPATAGVRINSDGTVDKREQAVYTQINASTDWIIPNGAAGHYVRCTATGDPLSVGSSATGSWLATSGSPEWFLTNGSGGTTENASLTIEIASDSGGTDILDSATITLAATRT